MAKKAEKITDGLVNTITGRNIETFYLEMDEMVSMLDKLFIQPATTEEEYKDIAKVVRAWFKSRLESKDGRYEMKVSRPMNRLTRTTIFDIQDRNYIQIYDRAEDKYYKYRAIFWGKFMKTVKCKLEIAQKNPSQVQ
jgi:hypothetical protein